ncbi:cation/H(+) antiporter 15-like [Tasmannia lanceolata]|uniref:cation/H(+) antiporter 15-like n=1 Tax=Tasmannia lanceolata TaxID=3420 RepID=UPI004062CC6E
MNISSAPNPVCFPIGPPNSNGLYLGDNPFNHFFSLCCFQVFLMTIIMRIVRILLMPLKQPEIVSQLIGGIIIGPSFLGRNKIFAKWVFPLNSHYTISTVSEIGSIIFLFIGGVKQDPSMIKRSGRKAVVIAISGWFLSIVSVSYTASFLGKYVTADIVNKKVFYYIATTIAATNFPVVQPILVELNLLNCDLGRLAMVASLVNVLIGWGVFIATNSVRNSNGNVLRFMFDIGSEALLIIVLIYVARPMMKWIIRKTPKGKPVSKKYIPPILLSAFVVALVSLNMGATITQGPLFLGLAIPDGLPLGARIVESFETVNNIFFLPFYFSKVGITTNFFSISSWKSWWVMQVIICSGYIGKTVGTILPCLFYKMPWSDSISLGLILNFKGIMELFAFRYFLDLKLIYPTGFSGLVFSTIMMTAVSTVLVSMLNGNSRRYLAYNRRTLEHSKPGTKIDILTCIHGDENIPSIINLLEASNSTRENPICVYAFHLVELVGRLFPIFIAHDSRGKSSSSTEDEHFVKAFQNYEQHKGGLISIQPFTVVSPYKTMHEDICKFALDKKVKLIIIPFHKQRTIDGRSDETNNALRVVNPNILENAPCSVGVLVDCRGLGSATWTTQVSFSYNIAVIFLGGADDLEVLAYASRMAEHPQVSLTVMRFLKAYNVEDPMGDGQFHDKALEEFRYRNARNQHVVYREEVVQDGPEMVTVMRSMGSGYDLMMTGRQQSSELQLLNGLSEFSESSGLGPVGDILASPDFFGGMVSVLVVQQQRHMQTVAFKV